MTANKSLKWEIEIIKDKSLIGNTLYIAYGRYIGLQRFHYETKYGHKVTSPFCANCQN